MVINISGKTVAMLVVGGLLIFGIKTANDYSNANSISAEEVDARMQQSLDMAAELKGPAFVQQRLAERQLRDYRK